ncbi:MAG: TlpA family protein disulfide reductase [Planctomycetota bacterium]
MNALSPRSWSSLPAALLVAAVVACGDGAPADGGAETPSGLDALSTSAPAAPSISALNRLLPKVGDPLPPIVGSTLDGERVDNDSLHGRTVLLNLWFIH